MRYTAGPASHAEAFPELRAYRYCAPPRAALSPAPPPHGRLEILFCQAGGLRLTRRGACPLRAGSQEILLLSDKASLQAVQTAGDGLRGVLVTAALPDPADPAAGYSAWAPAQVHAKLEAYQGAAVVRGQPWLGSLFSTLDALPAGQQGDYCILKTAELFYLLCCGTLALPQAAPAAYYDEYQLAAVRQVEAYMAAHLGERMTIPALARRFRLSPTLLKTCFRQLYGEPVHTYLRRKRLEQAAALLASTSLSVLQVAGAVGYGSVSQFGTAFKQRYHASPVQYRRAAQQKNV